MTDEWFAARVRAPALEAALRGAGTHSALLLPVALHGITYGLLLLARGGTRAPFTSADLPRARLVTDLLAGALRTERSVQSVQQQLRERERVEHELRASVRREARRAAEFSAIMEAVPIGVFLAYDRDCRVIRGNSTAYRLVRAERHGNASMSAPEGERVVQAVMREDGRVLRADELPMQRAARDGTVTRNAEHEFTFPDGTTAHMLINCVPLLDEHGVPRGAVAAMLDVTRLKETERELLAHRERLEHLVEERTTELTRSLARLREVERIATIGTLAAGLGHDLSNLLLPLRLRLESLLEQDLPRGAKADVRALAKTEEYLRRLAQALRLLAANPDPARERGVHVDLAAWWQDSRPCSAMRCPRAWPSPRASPPTSRPWPSPPPASRRRCSTWSRTRGAPPRTRPAPGWSCGRITTRPASASGWGSATTAPASRPRCWPSASSRSSPPRSASSAPGSASRWCARWRTARAAR